MGTRLHGILSADAGKRYRPVGHTRQQHHRIRRRQVTAPVAHRAHGLRTHRRKLAVYEAHPADRLRTIQQRTELSRRHPGLRTLPLPPLGLELLHQLSGTAHHILGGIGLHRLGRLLQQMLLRTEYLQHIGSGHRLDTAHTGRHRGLGQDMEQPELCGIVHVRAAAELHRHVGNRYDTHHVAVLLPEQRHGAELAGLLNRHLADIRGDAAENPAVDQLLHLLQLLRRQRGKMRKVKPHTVLIHQLARLLHVRSEHTAQRRLQQVRRRMVAGDGRTGLRIHDRLHRIAHAQVTHLHRTGMQHQPVRVLGRAEHLKGASGRLQQAAVTHLTAALSVKRRHIEHHDGLVPDRNGLDLLIVADDRGDPGGRLRRLVSDEFPGR